MSYYAVLAWWDGMEENAPDEFYWTFAIATTELKAQQFVQDFADGKIVMDGNPPNKLYYKPIWAGYGRHFGQLVHYAWRDNDAAEKIELALLCEPKLVEFFKKNLKGVARGPVPVDTLFDENLRNL